ncbi:3-hydroxyacyl-CoA dehydrogenase family protein [Microbacterium sp. NPDC055683]
MTHAPAHVGVIGGGRMGAGIAQAFAQAGSAVTVVERDSSAADGARARLADGIAKAAARRDDLQPAQLHALIEVATDYAALSPSDLVVEAVPEVIALKVEALGRAEDVIREDAWLTTNTSSLPVTRLSQGLRRPARFCGLHFFNPVPPSTLVEIVASSTTSAEMVDAATGWVSAIGKTAIVVRDSPGFASSRLGNALALEAMRMVEEGVASAHDIDTAMELGYRHAAGPLRTSDLVGLDVRLGICEHLHAELGDRFEPPQILRDMVAAGELGRKTGRGFFDYA